MYDGFWKDLRLGFLKLRQDCAIDPPLKPAGRLIARWTALPEPGWRLEYFGGKDGSGAAVRFTWHADSASARLGCIQNGDAALAFWLDAIRLDAPKSHLRQQRIQTNGGPPTLYSVEILDICGISADYCRKCEADETRLNKDKVGSFDGQVFDSPSPRVVSHLPGDASDLVDRDLLPLGANPFPPNHCAFDEFEAATWRAKKKIAKLKMEFQKGSYQHGRAFLDAAITYKKRWFAACAFEATIVAGNEKTAEWYERWLDNLEWHLLEGTGNGLRLKDPSADPNAPPFLDPQDIDHAERELARELMVMVTHYKLVVADQVLEIIQSRNDEKSTNGEKTEPESAVSKSIPRPDNWEDIELFFVDDHHVEIRIRGQSQKLHYKEMTGFEDRRSGLPNQLWAILRVFASLPEGKMPENAKDGEEWLALKKKIERASKVLRKHFGLTGDPIPHGSEGYYARIKLKKTIGESG